VPKGSLLTLLHDVGGPALSGRYAASKKPDISASCPEKPSFASSETATT
jgi:ParB family chromosome partitioning protein